MIFLGRPILMALLTIAAVACNRTSAPVDRDSALGPGQVATINGERIPQSVFRFYAMSAAQKNADDLTADERSAVLEALLRLKLLAAAAEKRGMLAERTIAAELEVQRLQVVARAMALRYLQENPATEAELRAVYEENLPRLAGTQYKARHILLESRDDAVGVIEQLQAGEDFEALAQEHSSGPTGPNGGDLGWFTADSMVQPVAEAVRAMQPGTYSTDPVETDFGYHVLLLEDTRTQEPPALDALRAELTSAVDRNKLEAFVVSLREAAVVTTEQ